jgi:hypothetical protein
MAHLVDEEQDDEAESEPPAEEELVGGDGDERCAGGGEQLELGEEQQRSLDRGEELREQGGDGGERAAEASTYTARLAILVSGRAAKGILDLMSRTYRSRMKHRRRGGERYLRVLHISIVAASISTA